MPEEKNNKNKYLILTGIAFQMMATMFIFIWLGRKGDDYFQHETAYLTLIGTLLGLGISMYFILKQLKDLQ